MNDSKKPQPVYINGPVRDIVRFVTHLFERSRRVKRSDHRKPREGNVSQLAILLHPQEQKLKVSHYDDLGNETRLYRLQPEEHDGAVAVFRAGSYISVEIENDDGTKGTRPYSICNTPKNSQQNNFYELCIKSGDDGYVSGEIVGKWENSTAVSVSAPEGAFTYEALRDGSKLVFIAGGTGITPFRSMADDILAEYPACTVTLIQGAAKEEELYFYSEFKNLESRYPRRFHHMPVISSNEESHHRKGFIDSTILNEAMDGNPASLFICGPPAMHQFLDIEIPKLTVKPKRIRREDYGGSGKPSGKSRFTVKVRQDGRETEVAADPNETVLVALERAGLNPPSSCRNGTCGFCRSRLLEGTADYDKDHQGLRLADKGLGYFHPCVARPSSDMIIEIPERVRSGG